PGGKQAITPPLLAFGLTTFRLPEDFGKIPGEERTMGGYGSGRPSGTRSRGLVESCLVLDINELLRKRGVGGGERGAGGAGAVGAAAEDGPGRGAAHPYRADVRDGGDEYQRTSDSGP